MNENDITERIQALEIPLAPDLIEELIDFWEDLLEIPFGYLRDPLAGTEIGENRDTIYLIREGAKLAGTSHLTICQSAPELGGLGEVATAPEFRRAGIATALCERAREDFRKARGRALFLGTVNPEAARMYTRLGWRKLAGANVMAFIADGRSPKAFLVDRYRQDDSPAAVTAGVAGDRVAMIPLLVSPHNWQVMDANVGMYSTRFIVQSSCMGLYPRYEAMESGGKGAWFAGRTHQGRVVGLSTSRLDDSSGCQVDGFAHPNSPAALDALVEAAVSWADEQGAARCRVRVAAQDEDKMSRFEKLGFRRTGEDEPLDVPGGQVASVRLEMNT